MLFTQIACEHLRFYSCSGVRLIRTSNFDKAKKPITYQGRVVGYCEKVDLIYTNSLWTLMILQVHSCWIDPYFEFWLGKNPITYERHVVELLRNNRSYLHKLLVNT